VVVTAGAVPPAYGAYVEIIPAATVTSTYIVTHILFDTAGWGGNVLYQFQLAHGAGDTFAGEMSTYRLTNDVTIMPLETLTIPANDRLRIRSAVGGGAGGDTAGVKVFYREV
jgi:hypothetical protein